MGKPLGGKVALVTGATRLAGIGAAIANALAGAGALHRPRLFPPLRPPAAVGGRDSEPEQLLAQLRRLGVCAAGFEVDLSRSEGAAELFASVRESLGPVHILVNNAAYSAQV